jgi:hypothetical protein
MKIGMLLTAAIVSLSAVGGGLAVYVAVTKYETMDEVSEARERLAIVRAVGDIPRYLNSERGFSTNLLFGPATIDPKLRAELNDKYRKNTDGAREKMNRVKAELPLRSPMGPSSAPASTASMRSTRRCETAWTRRSTARSRRARIWSSRSSPKTRC